MGDRMRPVPFDGMLRWISSEYGSQGTIFGIPESHFFRKQNGDVIPVFDESCDTPIGPAAGPHTQLAQNIVAAYLAGGRFIELKTVQKLDSLEFDKPCIDARDEGYNTEWSTELSLEQALDEYVKGWILLQFIERVMGMRATERRSFVFNMSVGYDLEGLKTPKMDAFIDGLIDASTHSPLVRYLEELDSFIQNEDDPASMGSGVDHAGLRHMAAEIPNRIAESVTLSTMHGCPPDEIESIATYLMQEKKLHTFVKLNPTLLGHREVREILNNLGYAYIGLQESTFSHDLQYGDALHMLERLVKVGASCGRIFGVKLSNTLGTMNTDELLPGDDKYMSGRALFPLTITLAARLSHHFHGNLPISFSGGVSQLNISHIFETGIRPITFVTDLLKPGGYLRMTEMARTIEPLIGKRVGSDVIDVERLDRLAASALEDACYRKEWRGKTLVSIDRKLPLTDCYVAPCAVACPVHQDIPEYLRLVKEGRYDRALELIYTKNPLPNITGHICDHQCMYNCTRCDYEGPVEIRELKRIAADHGKKAYKTVVKKQAGRLHVKAAIVGAGPAGLAASWFLAQAGFSVTVFEKEDSPGGVVNHVLPRFRIPASAVERDIATITSMGVDFRFGVDEIFSIDTLKEEGYKYIFIGIGAGVSRQFLLEGDNGNVYEALDFLQSYRKDPDTIDLGRRVAVIGGGNTAMDGARAAMRVKNVEEVAIVYRRTEEEMPADREEFDNALKDGVTFEPLLLPESFDKNGILRCRRMCLGEPDSSGRRSPRPTVETRDMGIDSVISAIGEHPDMAVLAAGGLKTGEDGRLIVNNETLEAGVANVFIGGDAFRGPSTVVESIADAKRAAESIASREIPSFAGFDENFSLTVDPEEQIREIYEKRGKLFPIAEAFNDREIADGEFKRCLECSTVCNKCVDVCPNRANVCIRMNGKQGFHDPWQILHLDALCNECGNCGTFCPYDGLPYRDKLTLFNRKEDFDDSSGDGFLVTGRSDDGAVRTLQLRLGDGIHTLNADEKGVLQLPGSEPADDEFADRMRRAFAILDSVMRDYGYLLDL
jgi:putative selenate reductase